VVNEEVSLSLNPAFLGGDAAAFPLDADLDLIALRPAAAAVGRFLARALTPAVDAAAMLLTLSLTANLTRTGMVWALITFGGLVTAGSWDPRLELRASRDIRALAAWIAIGLVASLALTSRLPGTPAIARLAVTAFVALFVGRVVAYGVIHRIRAHHLVAERTLIVGAGPLSSQLATTLREHPEFGLAPIGFLDGRRVVSGAPMAVMGDYSTLERIVRQFKVRRVIIGFGRNLDLVRSVRICQELRVAAHLIARGADLGITAEAGEVDHVMGLALLRQRRSWLMRPSGMLVKRAVDVTLAALALALCAPLFAGAALATRLSSPGPVFFRQRRIGRNGAPFDVLKFRSMRVNTDSDTCWSVAQDRRVTRVGRILRKTSIDELPQLINVLRGDMSLIGPRPERPHFVEQFGAEVPHYHDRHRAKVGITGWAQVHKLRGDTSITERARMDNYYVEHWSPWLDLVIAMRTFAEVFRGAS
jgi:exopolysaccharide biosynthesis polyprenyl glycosylphosphotransferase